MEIRLLEPQYDFLTSPARIACFVGGIGCGKSFTLAQFCFSSVVNYPNTTGLLVANTYSQLINATIPKLTSFLDEAGVKYTLSLGTKKYIKIGKTEILIYSLENYDVIRGIEVGWIAGDEISFSSKEAIDVILGRMRCPRGPLQARFATTTNGFNWFYDWVKDPKQKIDEFTMRTKDNPHLPEGYYDLQVANFGGENTPKARQELFGEYVNALQGLVYHNFKRSLHVKETKEDPNQLVYVCCDFNAGNMNYVAFQYTREGFKVIKSQTLYDFLYFFIHRSSDN